MNVFCWPVDINSKKNTQGYCSLYCSRLRFQLTFLGMASHQTWNPKPGDLVECTPVLSLILWLPFCTFSLIFSSCWPTVELSLQNSFWIDLANCSFISGRWQKFFLSLLFAITFSYCCRVHRPPQQNVSMNSNGSSGSCKEDKTLKLLQDC